MKIGYKAIGMIAILFAAETLAANEPPRKIVPAAEIPAFKKESCGISVTGTEGPYFVSGTQALKDGNLNPQNLPGVPLSFSGHVYEGLGTSKPLSNVKVEIWQSDIKGQYHPEGNGPASKYKPEEITLRGYVMTDAKGVYQFNSIYPAPYPGRSRHMHFKVKAEGFPEYTYQLMMPAMEGDPLNFATDPIAKGLPYCQLLNVDYGTKPASSGFDFHLSK